MDDKRGLIERLVSDMPVVPPGKGEAIRFRDVPEVVVKSQAFVFSAIEDEQERLRLLAFGIDARPSEANGFQVDPDTMPLPLLPPSALDLRSEGDGSRAFPIRDGSRAPVIGRWALWLAIDDDGAAYAYAECPRFQPSGVAAGEWLPREGSRYERIDADALDMDALNRNRMPRNGNGRCFLLVEPVDRYTRPRSIFARIRRAVGRA